MRGLGCRVKGMGVIVTYLATSLHIFAGGSVNIPHGITITGTDTTTNSINENVTLSDGNTIPL